MFIVFHTCRAFLLVTTAPPILFYVQQYSTSSQRILFVFDNSGIICKHPCPYADQSRNPQRTVCVKSSCYLFRVEVIALKRPTVAVHHRKRLSTVCCNMDKHRFVYLHTKPQELGIYPSRNMSSIFLMLFV